MSDIFISFLIFLYNTISGVDSFHAAQNAVSWLPWLAKWWFIVVESILLFSVLVSAVLRSATLAGSLAFVSMVAAIPLSINWWLMAKLGVIVSSATSFSTVAWGPVAAILVAKLILYLLTRSNTVRENTVGKVKNAV